MFRQLALVLLATSLSAPALAQTSSPVTPQAATPGGDVTRATLDNGLRVVIVRDPLAPVVTVEENYLVGANETPPGFPGMAHAQEHMAFRGCAGVTADQIAAIFAQLGGFNNAAKLGKIGRAQRLNSSHSSISYAVLDRKSVV